MVDNTPKSAAVNSTHKPQRQGPQTSRLRVSEATATVTGRPDFNADDILLGSGLNTVSIAASAATFGSYEYRVINFTLTLGLKSGQYTFTSGQAGDIHALSYVEFATIGGNEVYYNCEGLSGTLDLQVEGSTYTLTAFSFSAKDSEGIDLTVTGNLAVSSTLCECD